MTFCRIPVLFQGLSCTTGGRPFSAVGSQKLKTCKTIYYGIKPEGCFGSDFILPFDQVVKN